MTIYENQLKSMKINENHEHTLKSMEIPGIPWKPIEIHENL